MSGRPRIGVKIEVRLAPETIIHLDIEAERQGISRAGLIREVVETYVAQLPSRRITTWGEL